MKNRAKPVGAGPLRFCVLLMSLIDVGPLQVATEEVR